MSAGRSQTSRQSVAVARLVVVCLAIFSANVVPAFQIGSSTSRGKSFGSRIDVSRVRASSTDSNPSTTEKSVTSGLISQLAVIALKLRLKGQTHVACDVNASSSKVLLQGKVGPVTVKGRGWQSRLGLTCRAIEATVNTCQLDMSRVISNQKLVLTTPGRWYQVYGKFHVQTVYVFLQSKPLKLKCFVIQSKFLKFFFSQLRALPW